MIRVTLTALVAIYLLLKRWAKTQQGAEIMDTFKMNLPIVGSIWQRYQIAVFSRMMSTLLAGGLPLVTALETAGQSMASRLIVRGIKNAAKSVREGQTLAQSLEETGVFPDLAVELVGAPEAASVVDNPAIAVQTTIDQFKMSRAVAEASTKNLFFSTESGPAFQAGLKALAGMMIENKMLDKEPDWPSFINTRFLPA